MLNWCGVRSQRSEIRSQLCPLFPVLCSLFICSSLRADWQPANGPLMTRWAKQVSPDNVHAEYPRPQMVRKSWWNLNGLWEYAIQPKDEPQPKNFDGQILVPFPAESALSGVMKPVGEENRLWYRRTFEIPRRWANQSVLLHFGAVDWGYRSYKTREELTDAYLVLLENLRSLIGGGLCAGVYTQTTDVEMRSTD
ncbi:MAG: hypothetical protein ABIL62_00665 [Planctomycetota bacterium]